MKKIQEPVILSSAYLPNIQYISKMLMHQFVIVDIQETYVKQSFRNRCSILGANGTLSLSIPVIKVNGNHTKTKDIQIDNTSNWSHVHWGAIVSAYGKSPFFEIFYNELNYLYEKKFKYLVDFNEAALYQIFDSLGLECKLQYSQNYIENDKNVYDYRNSIHPKPKNRKEDLFFKPYPYFQVFGNKFDFIENLSFIDLLFNEGPQAVHICKQSINQFQD